MNAEQWDARYAGKELVWTAQANQFLVQEVTDLSSGRALDLGAGEGRNAVWLAENAWTVDAVDFSRVALEKGQQLAAQRVAKTGGNPLKINWLEKDVTRYEPKASAYDLVLLMYIHLPQEPMQKMLAASCRALAPGGTLLLVGHARRNIEDGHGGPQDPSILYQPEDLTPMLDGLTIHKAQEVTRSIVNGGTQTTAIDCMLRAQRVTLP